MSEVWLHSNRRILLLAMVPVGALGGLGLVVLAGNWLPLAGLPLAGLLGASCLGVALLLLVGLVRQMIQPRIAYHDGHVLFFLKTRGSIAVPVHVVEAFFQGEGLAHLPGASRHQAKSVNLIARLSQREVDWQQQEVKPALGRWAEGYVTIRGTWCEPINGDTIRRLNRRLGEVTRADQADSAGVADL